MRNFALAFDEKVNKLGGLSRGVDDLSRQKRLGHEKMRHGVEFVRGHVAQERKSFQGFQFFHGFIHERTANDGVKTRLVDADKDKISLGLPYFHSATDTQNDKTRKRLRIERLDINNNIEKIYGRLSHAHYTIKKKRY
jgi:hypothetical protein